jgi:hypothetical protein
MPDPIPFPTKARKRQQAKARKIHEEEQRKAAHVESIKKYNEDIKAKKEAPRWSEEEKSKLITDLLKNISYNGMIPKVVWDENLPPTTLCTVAETYGKIEGTALNCIEMSTDRVTETLVHIHGVMDGCTYDVRLQRLFPDGCSSCVGTKSVYVVKNGKWDFCRGGSNVHVYPVGVKCRHCQAIKDLDRLTEDFINKNPSTDKLEKAIENLKSMYFTK